MEDGGLMLKDKSNQIKLNLCSTLKKKEHAVLDKNKQVTSNQS